MKVFVLLASLTVLFCWLHHRELSRVKRGGTAVPDHQQLQNTQGINLDFQKWRRNQSSSWYGVGEVMITHRLGHHQASQRGDQRIVSKCHSAFNNLEQVAKGQTIPESLHLKLTGRNSLQQGSSWGQTIGSQPADTTKTVRIIFKTLNKGPQLGEEIRIH